jgi:Ca2+-binding EF-hand superfamily protein
MSARRFILPALAAACLAGAAAAARAQVAVPPAVAAPAAPAKPAGPAAGPLAPAPESRDAQDVVFFSDARPILVRLHVLVNGRPFPAAWDDFVTKLFNYYDLDGDGVLTKKETQHLLRGTEMVTLFGGQVQIFNFQANFVPAAELDTNKDGKITREEFAAYYRKFGGGSLQAQQNPQGGTSGQMTTALFQHLDLNKDGKISKEEFAQAPLSLRKADADDDEMVSMEELQPPRNNVYYTFGGQNMTNGLPDNSAFHLIVPGTPLAPLTKQLLARYDKDHNGKLSRQEIGLDQEAFDRLDANHDGQLDAAELAKWVSRPADVEFLVQVGKLAGVSKGGSIFDPLSELSKALSKKEPLDLYNPLGRKMPLASSVHKEGAALVLTLPDAEIELQRGDASRQNFGFNVKQFYLQQFDQIDTDKKGYLEKKQFDNPQFQFLRPLFDLADRDGDGKLYKKEVSAFVDLMSAGATANTYLKITDQGRGLFELLDANADGRLSVRELRNSWSRVAAWDRNGDGMLEENEVPRMFQVAVDQGQMGYPFQVAFFAGPNRAVRRQPGPKGPLWFRKMDRNNDGDVSFREWLGTEEEFRRIDTDGDGLISAEEATRADELLKKKEVKKDAEAKAPAGPPRPARQP